MDEKTRTAAGIAAGLQGMKYDDKRLAEIAAEVNRCTACELHKGRTRPDRALGYGQCS